MRWVDDTGMIGWKRNAVYQSELMMKKKYVRFLRIRFFPVRKLVLRRNTPVLARYAIKCLKRIIHKRKVY